MPLYRGAIKCVSLESNHELPTTQDSRQALPARMVQLFSERSRVYWHDVAFARFALHGRTSLPLCALLLQNHCIGSSTSRTPTFCHLNLSRLSSRATPFGSKDQRGWLWDRRQLLVSGRSPMEQSGSLSTPRCERQGCWGRAAAQKRSRFSPEPAQAFKINHIVL